MNLLPLCTLFLALFGVQEPSNPPSPSAGELAEKQKNKGQTPESEQKHKNPILSLTGDTESTPTQRRNNRVLGTSEDHKQEGQKDSNDRLSHKVSRWIYQFLSNPSNFLGLGLIVVTIGLIIFTRKQWKAAQEQNRLIQQQIKVDKAGNKIAEISNEISSKGLELNEFILKIKHRPCLRARGFIVKDIEHACLRDVILPKLSTLFREGMQGKVEFHNIGGTHGTPVQYYVATEIVIGKPMGEKLYLPWKDIQAEPVPPGESYEIEFGPFRKSNSERSKLSDQRVSTYIVGAIRYTDEVGFKRKTAFCRKFNPDTKRFEREENNDYEYED